MRLSISSVARLRDPNGRPAGFPLSPFSNGMAYSFLFARKNTPLRGRILRPRSKKPGAVSRPGG
jgi:hypothetical protein